MLDIVEFKGSKMAIVILKTNAGMNFHTTKGTISLKGFCLLNEVSNDEVKALKENNSFAQMIDNGYAEVCQNATLEDSHEKAETTVKEQVKKQSERTKNITREK